MDYNFISVQLGVLAVWLILPCFNEIVGKY